MKKILFVLITVGFLHSCVTLPPRIDLGYTYDYKFSLQNPTKSDSLSFDDEKIGVDFAVLDKGIGFRLINKTGDILKVNWDEAVIIWDDKSKKVVHTGVRVLDAAKSQPMSVVPPNAELEDVAFLAEDVDNESRKLFIKDDYGMENIDSAVMEYLGYTFSLYLPIIQRNEQLDYNFVFKVDDIYKSPKPAQLKKNKKAKGKREVAKDGDNTY